MKPMPLRALSVELREVLSGPRVLVDLGLEIAFSNLRQFPLRRFGHGKAAFCGHAQVSTHPYARGYAPVQPCGPGDRALDCPVPAPEQPLALGVGHPGLVGGALAPHLADALLVPEAGRDPGQVGGAERGRLGDLGHDHGHAQHVGLELHQPGVGDGAAVGLQRRDALARGALLRPDRVDRLVGDRLERRAGEVGALRPPREADDRAARVGVPVRRAEPGQGGDEVDVVVRVQRGGERLGLGRVGDDPEPVAQPLHGRAGDEDRGLERVVGLAPRGPRRPSSAAPPGPPAPRCRRSAARSCRCRRCSSPRRASSRPGRTAPPAGRPRCRPPGPRRRTRRSCRRPRPRARARAGWPGRRRAARRGRGPRRACGCRTAASARRWSSR